MRLYGLMLISFLLLSIHALVLKASNVTLSVPIYIANGQNASSYVPYQQELKIDSANFSSYINQQWSNVEFTTGPNLTGSVLEAWVESGNNNTSTFTRVWVKIPHGIGPHQTMTIYMNTLNHTVMSASGPTGEAPQLSPIYAEYDNGQLVFNFYDNFAGTNLNSANWFYYGPGTVSVNNGLNLSGHMQSYQSFSINTVVDAHMHFNNAEGFVAQEFSVSSEYGVAYGVGANSSSDAALAFWNGDRFKVYQKMPGNPFTSNVYTLLNNQGTFQAGQNYYYYGPFHVTTTTYNYSIFLEGGQSVNGGYINVKWIRVRGRPPLNIMPNASFTYPVPTTSTIPVNTTTVNTTIYSTTTISFTNLTTSTSLPLPETTIPQVPIQDQLSFRVIAGIMAVVLIVLMVRHYRKAPPPPQKPDLMILKGRTQPKS